MHVMFYFFPIKLKIMHVSPLSHDSFNNLIAKDDPTLSLFWFSMYSLSQPSILEIT